MEISPATRDSLVALAREALAAYDAVLVRVWTVGPGDACASCPMRPECPDQRACLHLAVSVGLTTRLDGPFRRFPIGTATLLGLKPSTLASRMQKLGVRRKPTR